MAAITPTTIRRENLGSTTLLINSCTGVTSADYLNTPTPALFLWANATSYGAGANSAVVRFANATTSVTILFGTGVMNLDIAYLTYA